MSWCVSCVTKFLFSFILNFASCLDCWSWDFCNSCTIIQCQNALTLVVMSCLMKIGWTFCVVSMLLNWANLGSYIIIWYYNHENLEKPKCEKNNYFFLFSNDCTIHEQEYNALKCCQKCDNDILAFKIFKRKQSLSFNFN